MAFSGSIAVSITDQCVKNALWLVSAVVRVTSIRRRRSLEGMRIWMHLNHCSTLTVYIYQVAIALMLHTDPVSPSHLS